MPTGPSLTFASANIGSQSSHSPQSVTVSNNGNAALTFPILGTGNNPGIVTGFTFDGATTCPQLYPSSSTAGTLAADASCVYAADFIPAAVTNTGSATLTDNIIAPSRFLSDDDVVVVLSIVTASGESAPQADAYSFRDGKIVKAQSFADTAMQERIYGTK